MSNNSEVTEIKHVDGKPRDGASHGLAETAARTLTKAAIAKGAPRDFMHSAWVAAFLTFISPLLILIAFRLL